MSKKKSGNNIKKNTSSKEPKTTDSKEQKNEIKYEAQPDVRLTPYTAIAMLVVLVSGAATVLGAVLTAKPFYYWLQTIYQDTLGIAGVESLSEAFEEDLSSKVMPFLIISVVLVAISTIISLVVIIRSMNPEKQPKPMISIISLIVSLGAIVFFAIGTRNLYVNSELVGFERKVVFTLYIGVAVAYILNAVAMIANIIGNYMGLSRFKKDGRAY